MYQLIMRHVWLLHLQLFSIIIKISNFIIDETQKIWSDGQLSLSIIETWDALNVPTTLLSDG